MTLLDVAGGAAIALAIAGVHVAGETIAERRRKRFRAELDRERDDFWRTVSGFAAEAAARERRARQGRDADVDLPS